MPIVLVAPEIPANTGNIARLCAATRTPLHLVRPLGFFLDDRHLKRAGLDYWPQVELHVHDTLDLLWRVVPRERSWFVSTKGTTAYTTAPLTLADPLVFGSEGAGLPPELLAAHRDRVITIPMSGPVRSLNLATAVAIVHYERLRQCAVLT